MRRGGGGQESIHLGVIILSTRRREEHARGSHSTAARYMCSPVTDGSNTPTNQNTGNHNNSNDMQATYHIHMLTFPNLNLFTFKQKFTDSKFQPHMGPHVCRAGRGTNVTSADLYYMLRYPLKCAPAVSQSTLQWTSQLIMIEQCFNYSDIMPVSNESIFSIRIYLH